MTQAIQKRDSRGRVRRDAQDNGGRKIPIQTFGGMTGQLETADLPEGLGEHGEAFWLATRESMAKMGILERADAIALQLASDCWESYMTAKQRIGQKHLVGTKHGGQQRNPEYLTMETSRAAMMKMINYLGMTPAARAKFAKPIDDDDPLQKLMRQRQATGTVVDAE